MPVLHSNYSSTQTCGYKQTLKSPPQRIKPSITKVLISHNSLMRLHIFSQPGTQPYWETASGKLLDSFPPPAVWAITDIQERSTGLHKNMTSEATYMYWMGQRIDTNTYKVEQKRHPKKLTSTCAPMDMPSRGDNTPFPQHCANSGLTRPIPLQAANTFLHLLPHSRPLLIRFLQGARTHWIPLLWGGWMSNSHNLFCYA